MLRRDAAKNRPHNTAKNIDSRALLLQGAWHPIPSLWIAGAHAAVAAAMSSGQTRMWILYEYFSRGPDAPPMLNLRSILNLDMALIYIMLTTASQEAPTSTHRKQRCRTLLSWPAPETPDVAVRSG